MEKETFELKDVRKMLQNNELMKKTFHRGGLRIGSQEVGDHIVKDPNRVLKLLGNNDCYHCKQPGHIKKNCVKYKEMQKKGGP